MNYNIKINPTDLDRHDDHSLFLKIYEDIQSKSDTAISQQELTEEITREINISRSRRLCRFCEGTAFLGENYCWECKGKGYYE